MVIALSLGALFSRLVPYTILNWANLAQLYGEDATPIYQMAVALEPNDFYIRRQIVRIALDARHYVTAEEAITPLSRFASSNSLLFADVLRILEATGQSDQVIELYDSNKNLNQSIIVSDTVALAYIEQGKYEEALVFRPTDLYLNSQLWQQAQSGSNLTMVSNLHEQLVYFPLNSIEPVNERVLKYTGNAILSLLENKLWTREDAIYATSYLIWQHYREPEVKQIVSALGARYPSDSAWSTLASELTQRRAKMQVSISSFSGSRKNENSKNLVQSTRLNDWNQLTAVRENVFWEWGVWLGKDHQGALFFGGPDPFGSDTALRIMNLWLRPYPENVVPPYAEYTSKLITLEPNTDYTLTLRYKTDQLGKAIAFIALLDYSPSARFSFARTVLPTTGGSWQNWRISGKGYAEPIDVTLLLRMSGIGSVWFDDVQLVKGDK